MNCPELDVLIALGDEALAEARARQVRAHAAACTRCEAELAELAAVRDDLRAPVPGALGRLDPESFADGVLAKLDERRAEPARRRLPRWIAALAVAAAVPLAFTAARRLAQPSPVPEEWAARGGASSSIGVARTLVRFGRVSGAAFEPISDGARLDPDALLAAEVGGTEGAPPRFLLAFLVDAAGERHWIYPAYEPETPPPSASPLPATASPRVLGSMVRLDRPARGPADLVAVVLDRSESVEHVERARREDLAPDRLSARYPGALVVRTRVEIQ